MYSPKFHDVNNCALKYLSIAVASTESECLFSKAGYIASERAPSRIFV